MNGPENPLADDFLGAAVDWQIRLTCGTATASDHEAFAIWLAADARHQAAWQRVLGVLAEPIEQIHRIDRRNPGQLPMVHQSLATAARQVSRQRRKIAGGSAMLLLATAGTGYIVHRSQPLDTLMADLHTGTAETHHAVLPDGSTLDLNARSAADVRFGAGQRLVQLRAGEILVQVVRDTLAGAPARPFVVRTRHGAAQAMDSRYLVRQEPERSLVVALGREVAVQAGNGMQRLLREGQAAWMGGGGIEMVDRPMAHHAAWAAGVLDVRNESLGDVVAALRPWRRGLIRISPAAARLRVFGVFRLSRTRQALQALVDTQPISVTDYGPMLTLIDMR